MWGKPKDLKLETLGQTPGLASCDRRELLALARVSDELDLGAGYTFAREGGSTAQTWVLLVGNVEISRLGVPLWVAGPGDLVGDLRVLGAVPAPVTAVATTDVRALVLERKAADTILRCPDLARWALANVQRHVRAVIDASTDRAAVPARCGNGERVPALA